MAYLEVIFINFKCCYVNEMNSLLQSLSLFLKKPSKKKKRPSIYYSILLPW